MSRILKERREDLAKEVNDIAQVTRIKGSYLRAIEEEEYEKLPVEVYTRGYIKKYAEYLGIPSDVALSPYERYLENKRDPKGKEHIAEKLSAVGLTKESHDGLENIKRVLMSEDEELQEAPDEKEPRKSVLSGKSLWAVPLIMAAIGLYMLIPRWQEQAPPAPPGPEQHAAAPEAPAASPIVQSPESKVVTADEKTAKEPAAKPRQTSAAGQEAASTPDRKNHNLYITATEKVWIQLVIDGSERKEMTLNPGEKINYGADKTFNLRIGNAAGVILKYDGKEIKNLGGQGEVVVLSLPAQKPKPQPQPRQQPEAAPGKGPDENTDGVSDTPDSQKVEPSNP